VQCSWHLKSTLLASLLATLSYGQRLLKLSTQATSLPPSPHSTCIIITGFPSNATKSGDQLLISFLKQATTILKATTTPINLHNTWSITSTINTTLDTYYLNITYPIIIAQQQIKRVRDPFDADYTAADDGRRPLVNPGHLTRWAFGEAFPPTRLAEGNRERSIFSNWIAREVLATDAEMCSNSFLLYFGSQASTKYHNDYRGPPKPHTGWSNVMISTFWGGPDFVVPVGEAAYFSGITRHEEILLVRVNIMAAKGCDGLISDLVRDLVGVGILKDSVAGRSNLGGGEVLVRRGEEYMGKGWKGLKAFVARSIHVYLFRPCIKALFPDYLRWFINVILRHLGKQLVYGNHKA
jgi:hypothetical protein